MYNKKYQLLNVLATIFVAFVVLLAILNFFSEPNRKSIFGYRGYTVISGSMVPALQIGDYVILKEEPFQQLKEEDIITFKNDRIIVTHRVVHLTSKNQLITRGDANAVDDLLEVTDQEYIGKVQWRIPFLGYFMILMQNPLFFSVSLALIAIRFVFLWIIKI
ncbi:signal peptidase I [Enterococcus lemanii]|uniref:Signal peptidase I n=1 Tax=Enterococcus lemanii TaxID=1159752 RepID=A0ABV9MQB7_9ENTE|nr:signal peptidase I [Enterococcus lemanii]MBM7710300.1 signal peptidase [Enterococcus lemanii]